MLFDALLGVVIMKEEQIIKRLNEINTELGHGDRANPAYLTDEGVLKVHTDHMSRKEIEELISWIGDWSFKNEAGKKHDLRMEKIDLQKTLKGML